MCRAARKRRRYTSANTILFSHSALYTPRQSAPAPNVHPLEDTHITFYHFAPSGGIYQLIVEVEDMISTRVYNFSARQLLFLHIFRVLRCEAAHLKLRSPYGKASKEIHIYNFYLRTTSKRLGPERKKQGYVRRHFFTFFYQLYSINYCLKAVTQLWQTKEHRLHVEKLNMIL